MFSLAHVLLMPFRFTPPQFSEHASEDDINFEVEIFVRQTSIDGHAVLLDFIYRLVTDIGKRQQLNIWLDQVPSACRRISRDRQCCSRSLSQRLVDLFDRGFSCIQKVKDQKSFLVQMLRLETLDPKGCSPRMARVG